MAEVITGVIGGSGLGDVLASHLSGAEKVAMTTPFGKPSGDIMVGQLAGRKVAFLSRHGDGHRFGPSQVPYRANIYALKKLGVRSIIASCAVGSLRQEIQPRHVVVPDQVIDKTFRRESSFFGDYGAVHCEMAQPFCNRMREMILRSAKSTTATVHGRGTSVCMEGPQFSTRAESLMHQKWGGDLIGMTAMPEAKLAREAQICYCLVALVSDYDCWREPEKLSDKQTLLREIIGNLHAAANNAISIIARTLEDGGQLCDESCPCRKSLELAVWTDRKVVPDDIQKALAVLFE
jgi:5'-methylthioadenosine phosphorylase